MRVLGRREWQWMKRVPLWLPILLIAFATYMTVEMSVTSDMGWYMNSGLNIVLGHGYSDMGQTPILQRAPGFPLMIAASYKVLGISVFSAFWVVRLFAILNPLLLFALGKALYGRWTGLVASLLLLTSYSANFWSYRHLDHISPALVIACVILLYRGFERRSYWWFVLSGLCLGAAFLVKEAALLMVPLPILLVALVPEYRSRRNLPRVLVWAASVTALISPWLAYVYASTGNLYPILGFAAGPVIEKLLVGGGSGEAGGIFWAVRNYCNGVAAFFVHGAHGDTFFGNFMIAPFLAAGWLLTAFRAARRDKAAMWCALMFLLVSPILAYSGLGDNRLGQGMLFLLLSYAVGGQLVVVGHHAVISVFRRLRRRARFPQWIPRYSAVIIVLALVGVQMFVGDHRNTRFLEGTTIYAIATRDRTDSRVVGQWSSGFEAAGEWLSKIADNRAPILASYITEGRALYFYSRGVAPIVPLPLTMAGERGSHHYQDANELAAKSRIPADDELGEAASASDSENIIFLSSWRPTPDPQNAAFALTESDLLGMITYAGIEYVVVGPMFSFLSLYFDASPGFSLVASFPARNRAIKVYEVADPSPLAAWQPLVTNRFREYLTEVRDKDPAYYAEIADGLLRGSLGLEESDVSGIETEQYGISVQFQGRY